MAYTLQEIFAALGKTENGGAMVADLQDAISQVRNEAASYRTKRNEVLDALGLRDGENTDAAIKALAQTLSAVKKAGSPETLGAQMESLQKEVKELTAKYAASEQKAAAEREKRIGASRTAALQSALSKGNALSPEAFVKLLEGNVTAKEDDSLVFMDGDKEISIDDGVAGWLGKNPWAVKNTAAGGGGTGGAGGGKSYTMDDLKSMKPDEINAHWADIEKSLGNQKG